MIHHWCLTPIPSSSSYDDSFVTSLSCSKFWRQIQEGGQIQTLLCIISGLVKSISSTANPHSSLTESSLSRGFCVYVHGHACVHAIPPGNDFALPTLAISYSSIITSPKPHIGAALHSNSSLQWCLPPRFYNSTLRICNKSPMNSRSTL